MKPLTSTEAVEILKSFAPGNYIFYVGMDDEEIKKHLAIQYAIDAIKERDDLGEAIGNLLETVRGWKGE